MDSGEVPGGASPQLHCIVGLGNPGLSYRHTRHNIGHAVVERLFETLHAATWRQGRLFDVADVRIAGSTGAEGTPWSRTVLLCIPRTYMNRSGDAVAELVQQHGLDTSSLLVVCDDIALPLGRVRLRSGGSSGGQNGLASILEALGTTRVPRLRCGVGSPPPGMDAAEYVLSPFDAAEAESAQAVIARAADAAVHALRHGMERTMNVFNTHTTTSQDDRL